MLYSSVTFVDLPGAVKEPDDKNATRRRRMYRLQMQANLSNCIDLMCPKQQLKARPASAGKKGPKRIVIPWRNSKLTMLLRDKIGGNNLTIMIGAISPARAELDNSRRARVSSNLRRAPTGANRGA